jgi:ferredoxin-NADP reductase
MAIIKKYQSRVVSIQSDIADVYTLELESLGRPFKYNTGQFLHLAMDDYDPSTQWPESRCFSIASSPGSQNIKITYSVKGYYTSKMKEQLEVGSEIWVKLPYGELFSQNHNKHNTVFIAGGTGVTPYLSLFGHESFGDYSNPRIYLGFRSDEYNIYAEELSDLGNFVKYFYQDRDGVIDINQICAENGSLCTYFISGPPEMINIFKNTLINNDVPVDQILTDDWE